MKTVILAHPHRQKHFDFFNNMDQPHLNICAQVEIGQLLEKLRKEQLHFTPTIVYLLSRAANAIPELRQRIRGKQIIEHELVHPSFTVNTNVDDVFSFCEVKYREDYQEFTTAAQAKMELMKTDPSFEDEHGRDDFLFLSAIPWINFTSIQHPMHYHPVDSVPRIAWGKYIKTGNQVIMPLSIQVHHALVDGIHLGRFFEAVQQLLDDPQQFVQ